VLRQYLPNKNSITAQQIKLVLLMGMLLGFIALSTKLFFVASNAQQTLIEKQRTVIALLEKPVTHALEWSSETMVEEAAQNALNLPYVRQVTVMDSEDRLVATVRQSVSYPVPAWEQMLAHLLIGEYSVVHHRIENHDFPSNDRAGYLGSIVITFDLGKSLGIVFHLFEVTLYITVIIGLIAILGIALMLDRFISKPIAGLTRQIEAVNAEDPHGSLLTVPRRHAKTEVGQAVNKLNAMLIHMGNVQNAMQHMATRDVATNLPNRTLTVEYLTSVARRSASGKPSAVFAVLLDRLDEVKDLIGHEKADEIAIEMAGNLLEVVGSAAFVGRIGVDSFAVVVEDLDAAKDAVEYAEKLLHELAHSEMSEDYGIRPSICVGIALCPNDGLDASGLLRKAVAATSGARRKSKDRWNFFEDAMAEGAQQRLQLEKELDQAIEDRAFVMYFQPQFSPQGNVIGVEALIRWPKEDRMVSPAEFIPVAEDSGLIVPLGDFVLEEVCRVAALLRDRGYSIPVAVNVSPSQLESPHFVQKVKDTISYYALSPKMIEMEITEYALAHEDSEVTDRVRELRGYGVRIAIDDFGTGYSSLSYLRRFPVDVLKIDRSFITDIPYDVAVPSTILALAQRMGMTCVAEGIETIEQQAWLAAHNCTSLQGFLMARPMPLEDFLSSYAPESNQGNVVPFKGIS